MSAPSDVRALVLAGGKGTRLAAAVPDRPKILAPIDGRPFLEILLDQLAKKGLSRFVFLLGDRHEQVVDALARVRRAHPQLGIEESVEREPLGTAGAIANARRFCTDDVFVINGDTYLDFDAARLLAEHRRANAAVTIAATRVSDAGRYGSLDVDADGRVRRFREKSSEGEGSINGGVYVVAPRVIDLVPEGRATSLESETFPQLISRGEIILAVEQRGAFFDIGTESSWKSFARHCSEREGAAT